MREVANPDFLQKKLWIPVKRKVHKEAEYIYSGIAFSPYKPNRKIEMHEYRDNN